MAITFFSLMEHMSAADVQQNDATVEVVRSGMNLSPDFWENFIQISGNSDGLAELLDVPKHKVAGWASKINDVLDRIREADDGEAAHNKAKPIPTGMPQI